jgi:hypothetical protein
MYGDGGPARASFKLYLISPSASADAVQCLGPAEAPPVRGYRRVKYEHRTTCTMPLHIARARLQSPAEEALGALDPVRRAANKLFFNRMLYYNLVSRPLAAVRFRARAVYLFSYGIPKGDAPLINF